MASEIQLTSSLSVTLGGSPTSQSNSHVLDIVGAEITQSSVLVPFAADQALNIGPCASIGYLMIENLDPTNFVTVSKSTGGSFASDSFAKIRPGCMLLIQPTDTTLFLQADTAAVRVKYTVVEE